MSPEFLPNWVRHSGIGGQLRLIPVVVLLGLLTAALEGVGIGLIIPMLSIIMGSTEASDAGGVSALFQRFGSGLDPQTRLVAIAAGILLMIALKNVFGYANSVLTGYIYGKASHQIRRALAQRLLTVGFGFFHQEDPGRLLNIIANESWRVSDAIQAVLYMIINFCAALILFGFLLVLSWRMTLIVAIGLAVIQITQAVLSSTLKSSSRQVTSSNHQLANRMLHLVHAGQLIRIFGQERREAEGFDEASDAVRRASFAVTRRLSILPPFAEIMYAALFLALLVGAWLAHVEFPLILAFVVLLYRLQPYVRALQGGWSQLQGWIGSTEEVAWLLDPAGKPAPPQGGRTIAGLEHGVEFRNVSFAYPGEEAPAEVLRDASFTLVKGHSTALIGRSGAGKTTIVNLICRLLEPTSGAILVDGTPLRDIDPAQWRNRLTLASQDLELVDGTVLDNIIYGRPSASAAEAELAAKAAEAHGFIQTLPQGYQTLVGYRGVNLSAGQRQRIALARAVVRDPDLLILDEATNAVDGLSEAAILSTLKARAGRRTTIVISHHRKTIAFCDDVVILRGGSVASQVPLKAVDALEMDELYEYARTTETT